MCREPEAQKALNDHYTSNPVRYDNRDGRDRGGRDNQRGDHRGGGHRGGFDRGGHRGGHRGTTFDRHGNRQESRGGGFRGRGGRGRGPSLPISRGTMHRRKIREGEDGGAEEDDLYRPMINQRQQDFMAI